MLHIAYRLDFKKWRVVGDEDKAKCKNQKSRIQKQLRERLGKIADVYPLQVDLVLQMMAILPAHSSESTKKQLKYSTLILS